MKNCKGKAPAGAPNADRGKGNKQPGQKTVILFVF